MITDTAHAHGAFLFLLLQEVGAPINIEKMSDWGSGFYLIEDKIPIYLKSSSKRKGPWVFNFLRVHREKQESVSKAYGECFTCLICGRDGVAGMGMSELQRVLDADVQEQECVSVRRRLNAMYNVTGSGGGLGRRISRRSIFDQLQDAIKQGMKT